MCVRSSRFGERCSGGRGTKLAQHRRPISYIIITHKHILRTRTCMRAYSGCRSRQQQLNANKTSNIQGGNDWIDVYGRREKKKNVRTHAHERLYIINNNWIWFRAQSWGFILFTYNNVQGARERHTHTHAWYSHARAHTDTLFSCPARDALSSSSSSSFEFRTRTSSYNIHVYRVYRQCDYYYYFYFHNTNIWILHINECVIRARAHSDFQRWVNYGS